jgi:hypothetical protein
VAGATVLTESADGRALGSGVGLTNDTPEVEDRVEGGDTDGDED